MFHFIVLFHNLACLGHMVCFTLVLKTMVTFYCFVPLFVLPGTRRSFTLVLKTMVHFLLFCSIVCPAWDSPFFHTCPQDNGSLSIVLFHCLSCLGLAVLSHLSSRQWFTFYCFVQLFVLPGTCCCFMLFLKTIIHFLLFYSIVCPA